MERARAVREVMGRYILARVSWGGGWARKEEGKEQLQGLNVSSAIAQAKSTTSPVRLTGQARVSTARHAVPRLARI